MDAAVLRYQSSKLGGTKIPPAVRQLGSDALTVTVMLARFQAMAEVGLAFHRYSPDPAVNGQDVVVPKAIQNFNGTTSDRLVVREWGRHSSNGSRLGTPMLSSNCEEPAVHDSESAVYRPEHSCSQLSAYVY
ncbi:hypothetical protein HAX54_048027 [Datura stramonium]|uniref:Uncharacterized protein n=1 Tax=Datura stramonium TaxID=4076 RepID=A0ABS8WIW4_DATST|nr:hypothetical protein [Datura stramonium]